MKNEMTRRINTVLNALNNITVSGKHNLANLSGSITVLEELISVLQNVSFEEDKPKEVKE